MLLELVQEFKSRARWTFEDICQCKNYGKTRATHSITTPVMTTTRSKLTPSHPRPATDSRMKTPTLPCTWYVIIRRATAVAAVLAPKHNVFFGSNVAQSPLSDYCYDIRTRYQVRPGTYMVASIFPSCYITLLHFFPRSFPFRSDTCY